MRGRAPIAGGPRWKCTKQGGLHGVVSVVCFVFGFCAFLVVFVVSTKRDPLFSPFGAAKPSGGGSGGLGPGDEIS